MDTNDLVVQYIRAEMAARGWSLEVLAERTGLRAKRLQTYLTPNDGKRRVMQLAIVEMVAHAFGMPLSGLVAEAERRRSVAGLPAPATPTGDNMPDFRQWVNDAHRSDDRQTGGATAR